jgi:hypothetical protein
MPPNEIVITKDGVTIIDGKVDHTWQDKHLEKLADELVYSESTLNKDIPHSDEYTEWDDYGGFLNQRRYQRAGSHGGRTERNGIVALLVCAFLLFGVK